MRIYFRRMGACLVVCILILASVMPVYAAVGSGDAISPMAMYYSVASADLTISSGGTAEATGKLTGIPGTTTKVSVYVYLQRYENGTWVNAYDWSTTVNGMSATLVESQNVARGYKYRVKASCYAYSGTASEQVIKYSGEVYY